MRFSSARILVKSKISFFASASSCLVCCKCSCRPGTPLCVSMLTHQRRSTMRLT